MSSICQLVHSLNVGGAEILAERFARRIATWGRVVFGCLDEKGVLADRLEGEGFRVACVGRRSGLDLACAWRLGRFIKEEKVALVHAHQYTPFFYAALARQLRGGPPILFTEHGRFFPDFPNRKRMLINPWLLRRRDRVVAVGECVRAALVHNEGIPRERIEVIYNGVDLERVNLPAARADARAELGLAEESFGILMVARLDPIKDHRAAVAAMARLRAKRPNARLFLAGDGPERANIERAAREHGASDIVRLLGTRRDIPRLLAAADAFLLTSVSEGIPLTVIEAMGASLPVVATRVGGLPEVVTDGETGFLVPSGDAAAIAAALDRLAGDPDLRRRLGASGRVQALARFREEEMMDRYDALFRALAPGVRR